MDAKKQFVKLCSMIYISSSGFRFPFDDIDYDDSLSEIRESENYPMLKSKMQNLLDMLNKDHSILLSINNIDN